MRRVSWPWLYQAVHLLVMGQGYAQKNTSNQAFLGGMKPVVFIGRFLCALSRTDVLKRQEESQRKNAILAVICGSLSLFFIVNALLQSRANFFRFQSDKTASEKLGELSLPSYAYTMSFVYSYQIFATKRFRKIVQNFMEASERTQISIPFPSSFPRFCWIVIFVCMTCGIAENAMYDLQSLRKAEKNVITNSTLELYYTANFFHWSEFVPYHPLLTLLYVILIKIGTWGWVYMDIIAIVLSRAITEKFRIMNTEVSELVMHHYEKQHTIHSTHTKSLTVNLIKSKIVGGEGRFLTITWDAIRDEFVMLSDLVLQIEKFIAPLILACYGANMYIIVINLLNWIAPYSKFSPEQSYYVYFAFVQFLFRVTIVTYFAAEVHHVSHGITRILQKCPNSLYSLSLERLERTFICNPTGICLFGSFMITRKFFISIISFIFTTEIVLLQTANAPRGK